MAKQLPAQIYVRQDHEGLFAETKLNDAVDGDGPTRVGVYKLVETRSVRKVIESHEIENV